ncbi:MAG: hypothetical protein IJ695_04240 [Butyrivibrio sp.]|nr:hypothetical protein [Butyrivibrio sp.]
MKTIEISEDNMDLFQDLIGEDLSDDLKRIYYRGIGVTDDDGSAAGALICELLNADREDEERYSRICFLKSGGSDAFDGLLGHYRDKTVEEEEIAGSEYELSDEAEAEALTGVGFSRNKKESEMISVTLDELSKLKIAQAKKIPGHIGSIEALSILQYRDAVKQILFKGHSGLLEDIPYLPMTWFDPAVSSCVISGDLVPGLFLIRRTPSGILMPSLYCAYGAEANKNLLYMLEFSLKKAIELYPPDTKVMVRRHNKVTRALTDKLLPDSIGEDIFYGKRKER